MNEDLAIGDLIPNYAGQGDATARRRSDQQARALVGEALTELRAKLSSDGITTKVDALIERCQFGAPAVFNALEDPRLGEPASAAQIRAADRDLVLVARQIGAAQPDELTPLIDKLVATFDRHDQLVLELADHPDA